MNKILAIKGDKQRGNEVIALLETLGGKNQVYHGKDEYHIYFIDNEGIITTLLYFDCCHTHLTYQIFTLEEFLEKYPFKVGDKVVYTKFGDNCDDYPVIIESMKWTGTTIEYTFDDCVTCLAKDLKMWNGEPDAVISGIYLNSCDYADEVELNLGDYEIEVRDGRTFAVKKKPVYPKTIEECVKLLGVDFRLDMDSYKRKLMANFYRLILCRDAYWKIAGEQMGLSKPWEPEYVTLIDNNYHTIQTFNGEIDKSGTSHRNAILAFPTVEMRDVFYENFKVLIENCKELL